MNGAVAKIGDEIVYDCQIPYQLARPLLMACDERGLKITAESYGEFDSIHYVNEHMHSAHYGEHQKLVDLSQHEIDSEKIYMVDLTPDDEVFILNQLPDNLYFVIAREGNGFGMIMHKDATKAKAVSALADTWGIKTSEIAAFGDDLNDIDLLSLAGISVAMGDALDKVKSCAKDICDTNDNDGVAKWLEENVLR
jgi:HAD superfamily hydrolase (TIGR01484 family)